jgi:tetratricopeptide (TPR) repeat protein
MRVHLLVAVLMAASLVACGRTPKEKLEAHKAQGAAYLHEGKVDEAILELRGALQIAPRDPRALRQLGEALLKKGQVREAFHALQQAVVADPKDPDARVRLGSLYLLGGKAKEARDAAQTVIATSPRRADAWVLLGKVLLREGAADQALGEFDRAIALEPAAADHRLVKATALLGMRRLDESRAVLQELLGRDPSNSAALLLLAQVADIQGDRPAVDQAFASLLRSNPESPGAWISYGNFWLTKGDTARALEAYRKAGEVDKRGAAGWERCAEVSLSTGDVAGARRAVEAIRAKNAKSIAADYYEARLLLGEKKLDDAVARFQEVLKQYPNHPEAHYFLGLARYGQKNPQQAKVELKKALEVNPRFLKARALLAQVQLDGREFDQVLELTEGLDRVRPAPAEPLIARAAALLEKGRPAEARGILDAVVRDHPRDARAQERLGVTFLAEKRPKEALQAFRKALEADPKNLAALELAARVLASQKKDKEAIALVEDHVRTAGDSAGARQILARLDAGRGDREGAKAELERAIALDPGAVDAYLLLSGLRSGPDAGQQALADLDRAVKRRPDHLQAWMLKGTLHEALGQVYEAEDAYRKVLVIRPDFVPALNNLAYNLLEHGGNADEALKFAVRARELAPNVAGIGDTLGWAYVKKGSFGKAVEVLEGAARGLPGNPQVHYHLGKAYEGIGERTKAAAALAKALKLSERFPGADEARKTLDDLKGRGRT